MQRPQSNFHNVRNIHHEAYNPSYYQNYTFPHFQPTFQYNSQNAFKRSHGSQGRNHDVENWCETCDRSFNSVDLLEQHKQQHQKCNIDGCQFIAHPKVITKHIQMQHASGLYKKIAKLNNPEEIQKWREERKKKYPTKVNIEKKAAEMKERIDRGEKMGLNQNRYNKQYSKGNGPNNKPHINENRRKQYTKPNNMHSLNKIRKPVMPKKNHNVLPTIENLRKLKPFAGIQDIIKESSTEEDIIENTTTNFIIEDDYCEDLPKPEKNNYAKSSEPKVCGALSSLICDYDFSDDDTEVTRVDLSDKTNNYECEKREVPATTVQINNNNVTPDNCNKIDDDNDGPEELKINKSNELPVEEPLKTKESCKTKKKVFIERKHRNQFSKRKPHIPSTLLQKLLRREVQQERNIILQCIRHIVQNNFFDKK